MMQITASTIHNLSFPYLMVLSKFQRNNYVSTTEQFILNDLYILTQYPFVVHYT